MPRYSRVRAPASTFETFTALTLLPGALVQRLFGLGPLLVSGYVRFDNSSGLTVSGQVDVRVDGVSIPGGSLPLTTQETGRSAAVPFVHFIEPSPGVRLIEVFVAGVDTALHTVPLLGCELVVIELPLWDSDDDLITL